jgi:hypothetical protein
MNLNTKETRSINALALHELARMMEVSDEDLDIYILNTRAKFMEYQDLRISEAIPKIVEGEDKATMILGAIMAIFTSDYYFDQYINGEINDNR